MGRNKQFRDVPSSAPIVVKRVNALMEDQKLTQVELAERCGISTTTISACFGKDKTEGWREPRANDLLLIAGELGVSVDYLLGENECEIPDDEQIYKKTGLSPEAIKKLKEMHNMYDEDGVISKKLTVVNYLLETAKNSTLLENLYNYLLGRFSFPGKEETMGAAFMVELLPNGKQRRNIAFKDVFPQACFIAVQEDLTRLKDEVQRQREAEEKVALQSQAEKEKL